MNQTIKSRWIDALRSGEYKQTQSFLCHKDARDGDQFCCLGVLTDLFLQDRGYEWTYNDEQDDGPYISYETLPDDVVVWAGLDSNDPTVDFDAESSVCLSKLNDNGVSFTQIADILSSQDPQQDYTVPVW